MKVVVDTNVLVSGLINPSGNPAQIVGLVLSGKLTVLYDNRIVAEYREVLNRAKFGFSQEAVGALLDFVATEGEYVVAQPQAVKIEQPDDAVFYDVAVSGEASYLITGNPKHFPNRSNITTPTEFLRRYRRTL